jgi:hypothetical protein
MTKTAKPKAAGMAVDHKNSRIIPPASLDGSEAYLGTNAPRKKASVKALLMPPPATAAPTTSSAPPPGSPMASLNKPLAEMTAEDAAVGIVFLYAIAGIMSYIMLAGLESAFGM